MIAIIDVKVVTRTHNLSMALSFLLCIFAAEI